MFGVISKIRGLLESAETPEIDGRDEVIRRAFALHECLNTERLGFVLCRYGHHDRREDGIKCPGCGAQK